MYTLCVPTHWIFGCQVLFWCFTRIPTVWGGIRRLRMTFASLRDALRWFHGGDEKEHSTFETEKEAYDFVQKLYEESGGVTPELRRAYEFYMKNFDDGCESTVRPSKD